MAMTLQLSGDQLESLRSVVYPFCAKADVEAALSRYPGKLGPGDVFPDDFTLDTLTRSCVSALTKENEYFARSFVLRLIEQKWSEENVRRGVVGALPTLVRPPRGFDAQIAALVAALDALIALIPATPSGSNIGDVATFRRFCGARDAIEQMVGAIQRFETLKAAHDGLHMLQVLGAGWLDSFAADKADESTAMLATLLQRVAAATSVDASALPPEIADSFARCVSASTDAQRRVATGDSAEIAFACAVLRATLIRELPIIDAAMFVASRDFPMRQLCSLFPPDPGAPALVAAWSAAMDLADTLRRRLLEHALWQSADLRIYALEQSLAQPSATPIDSIRKILPWLLRDLRVLLDPDTAARVVPAMNDAVLRHAQACDAHAPATSPPPSETMEGIRAAFANLRRSARSAFLDVDQALKLDFTRLLTLKAPLQTILDRVPSYCDLMAPP